MNQYIYIYIYKKVEISCESAWDFAICRTLWKKLKYFEATLEIRINIKIRTLYFLWFNVSKLIFITFFIQYFKTTICFHLVVLRFFLFSHTQKTFCISIHPFNFYSFIYTCPQPLALCHSISNTLRQKMIPFTFNLSTTPT